MFSNPHFRRQFPFIAVIFIFIIVSLLDRLLPEGMFFDGVIYACVARNEAFGRGNFWLPYFGHSSNFWEHPPLMFGLESLFFRVFGDHYFTEKIYCFATWLVTVWLMIKLWRLNDETGERRYFYWLPLLMWSVTPTILWAYPNNMLECTMCIFDIAAVILICRGLEGSNRWLNLTIAGICIVLAVLTKGPVGLFPLATPVIYWFVFRKHQLQSVILWTLYLLAVIAAIFFILSEISASRFLLYSYLNEQLFSSLAGKREHVDSSIGRFELLIFLLTELLPALVLTLLLFITGKLLKIKNSKYAIEHKTAVFFLLMGLCASLPIMVSIKQRSFYLVPSIPFYVTGLGMLIYPYISALTQKYTLSAGKMKILNAALLLATAGGVFYLLPKAEMVGRDEQTIKDVKLISTIITPRDTIATCTEMEQDYPFRAYVERYGRIEIKRKKLYRYVVVNREMCREDYTDSIMKMGYAKMNILTGKYDLYENRKIPVAKKDTIN